METTESTDVVKLLEEVDFEKAAVHMKARAIFMPNLLKQILEVLEMFSFFAMTFHVNLLPWFSVVNGVKIS